MYDLDSTELQKFIGSACKEPCVSIKPVGNRDVNYTVVATLKSGTQIFAKCMVRPPKDEMEHRRFEIVADIYLRLANNDLPSLRVHFVSSETRTIGDRKVYAVIILDHLSYKPLEDVWGTMDDISRISFAEALGKYVHSIHAISYPGHKKSGFLNQPNKSWQEANLELIEESVEKLLLKNLGDYSIIQKSQAILLDNLEVWDYPEPAKLLHNDLWHGNILINPTNLLEFVLIDWEWSETGDPWIDFLWPEEIFFGDTDALDAFFRGYGINPEELSPKIHFYQLLRNLEGAAFGFLYHNPSTDGYELFNQRLQKELEKLASLGFK